MSFICNPARDFLSFSPLDAPSSGAKRALMTSELSLFPGWPPAPDPVFFAGLALVFAGLAGEICFRRLRLPRITGYAVVGLVGAARARRLSAAGTALLAAVLVGSAVAVARSVVAERLQDQLRVAMPADRTADDFVGTGTGAWLSMLVLGVLGAANLVGWWRAGLPGASSMRKKPVRLDPG